jgi:hypothetical protein
VLRFDLCLQQAGGVLIIKDEGAFVPVVQAGVFRAAAPARPTSAHRGLLALKVQPLAAGHCGCHKPTPETKELSLLAQLRQRKLSETVIGCAPDGMICAMHFPCQ